MINSFDINVDVSEAIPLDGNWYISATLFLPDQKMDQLNLIFCCPGGSASRAYYHLKGPDNSDYSFAENLVKRGHGVVAFDVFGTGQSSAPEDGMLLTPELICSAHDTMVKNTVEGLKSGDLINELPALTKLTPIGVGHSLGGFLTSFQQSEFGTYEGIGVFGWPTIRRQLDTYQPDSFPPPHWPARNGYVQSQPDEMMRAFSYGPDVPETVIQAYEKTRVSMLTTIVRLSPDPSNILPKAAKIACPLYLCFARADNTENPHMEPSSYHSSRDITLFLLKGSRHAHNLSSVRHRFWNHFADWVDTRFPVHKA